MFAMANPVPEIMPDVALAGGAAIVATGRSDFPNQVNNVLAFREFSKGHSKDACVGSRPRCESRPHMRLPNSCQSRLTRRSCHHHLNLASRTLSRRR